MDRVLLLVHRVLPLQASKLSQITVDAIAQQMQVSESNPLVGLEGRTSLLINLGKALKSDAKLFGDEGRPGNMLSSYIFPTFVGTILTYYP